MEGFLSINKPKGISSFEVIRQVKKILRDNKMDIPKIGHTGTLDPFASGVLVLCIGRNYTKRASEIQEMDKEYVVKIKLGATSDTYDSTGNIKEKSNSENKKILQIKVEDTLKNFEGEIEQTPPNFSARKIRGVKAYKLARKGEEFLMPKSLVTIYSIDLLNFDSPTLTLRVRCSKGTYIRTLASDVGEALEVGAYAEELERTAVGDFKVEDSLDFKTLNLERIKAGLED